MYEFRAKTPTQYDFMSRVSPYRFEAKSPHKMNSSPPQKGHPFGVPPFYSSLPSHEPILCSSWRRSGSSSPLDEVLLCMAGDNWVIWPVISWGNVLFLNTNGFFTLTWTHFWLCRQRSHEPGTMGGSALSLLILISVLWCTITPLNSPARSIYEISEEGEEMRGEWGTTVISLSTVQLTRSTEQRCSLRWAAQTHLLWQCAVTPGAQEWLLLCYLVDGST